MTYRIAAFVALGFAAGVGRLEAQQEWRNVTCDLKPGHYLVSSGVVYLKNADSTAFSQMRDKNLGDAKRVLLQALGSSDQQKNPAAWYWLGRYYIETNDVRGVDTAFAKALALAPRCKDDINSWRRRMWVPVLNAGIAAWQAGHIDSAITALRNANQIYDGEPAGFSYLGTLFANAHQTDSAAKYFRLAIQAAQDPKFAKDKKDAMFNLARVYHAEGRYDDAVAAYQGYLTAYPRDMQATAGLAAVYSQSGKPEQARALYSDILAHADSADAADLFAVGRELLNGIPKAPDTSSQNAACRNEAHAKPGLTPRQIAARCDSSGAKAMRAYDAQVKAGYAPAEQAFIAGLAKSPYDRDALFTLAGVAALAGDTARALDAGLRLYALDPVNRGTLRMVAQAWQLRGRTDSTLKYLKAADSLSLEVTVGTFTPDEHGATVSGLFTNLKSKPLDPQTFTFEFLDSKGGVVTANVEKIPPLSPGENRTFEIKVTGNGITAWRYKR